MVFTRRNVWANNGDFDDPVLYWYARGVRILRSKEISDPTSWEFLAAIHGFDPVLWHVEGFLTLREKLPPYWVQSLYWKQCQHGSWYFLPWHRGYLLSFETIVREAIKEAMIADEKKGIKLTYHWTDWALPYWNPADLNDHRAVGIPPAFTSKYMPDGSDNPLYIEQRYGRLIEFPNTIANASNDQDKEEAKKKYEQLKTQALSLEQVLTEPNFIGTSLSSVGFGGLKTNFSHEATTFGKIESSPHNNVHGLVGGGEDRVTKRRGGLMADPVTAGLDPLFWLHHANVDRLWEVWVNRDPNHKNPYLRPLLEETKENESDNQTIKTFNRTQKEWLDGPGERGFMVPLTSGQTWEFRPKDVVNTLKLQVDYQYNLSYEYDDISDPLKGLPSKSTGQGAKMIGANLTGLELKEKNRTSTFIQIDPPASFVPSEVRFFLRLENITSDKDGRIINVYINLPPGAPHTDYPDLYAGSICFFGVRQASVGGGLGVTEVFEITDIIAKLQLRQFKTLKVSFIPLNDNTPPDDIKVEQVALYSETV
jgi:tyrosinase